MAGLVIKTCVRIIAMRSRRWQKPEDANSDDEQCESEEGSSDIDPLEYFGQLEHRPRNKSSEEDTRTKASNDSHPVCKLPTYFSTTFHVFNLLFSLFMLHL